MCLLLLFTIYEEQKLLVSCYLLCIVLSVNVDTNIN